MITRGDFPALFFLQELKMSANELVDIVNENDEVTDTVERHVMREKHLPHRASYIAVMDPSGRFLIEIRTLTKDYAPGLFDAVVGGVMQHGEQPDLSAARELKEEVGLDASSGDTTLTSLGKLRIPYRDGVHFLFGYLYLAKSSAITVRQQEEVMGIMLLGRSEVEKLMDSCTWDSQIAFKEILKRADEHKLLKIS